MCYPVGRMALSKYARRWAFGSNSDQLTPEEAGFFSVSEQLGGLGDGRRIVLKFQRADNTGLRLDAAQYDFEFVNFTGGVVDNTWIDSDFTALEGFVDTWWTSVKPNISSEWVLDQYRWYKFGPSLPLSAKGNEEPGPPVRVTERNVAGTSSYAPLPPQCAATVTFKTPVRKRWGRIYVGGFTAIETGSHGRLSTTFCTALANATDTLFASATTNDYAPVVYSRKRRSAFGITEVQVDDVADVIRSRRTNETAVRIVKNT